MLTYRTSILASFSPAARYFLVGVALALMVFPRAVVGDHRSVVGSLGVGLLVGLSRGFAPLTTVFRVDAEGVWCKSGLLPWARTWRGLRWSEIEGAGATQGPLDWLFRSGTVTVFHRYKAGSSIRFESVAKAKDMVSDINAVIAAEG